MITGIPLSNYRILESDPTNLSLNASLLLRTIEEDKAKGLIPCCVVATVGTTSTTANDNLRAIGQICMFLLLFILFILFSDQLLRMSDTKE
jgi:aromatic-L-amino-acid decarboxylase